MTNVSSKKLVFILPNLKLGGAQRVTVNLMNQAVKECNKVTLILIQEDPNEIVDLDPSIQLIRFHKRRILHSFLPLLFKLRALKADYVVSTLGYVNLFVLFISFFISSKTKIIVREANMLSTLIDGSKHPHLMRFIYNLLYKRAHKVLVTSSLMKQEFEQRLSCKEEQLSIYYNPVNTDQILKLSKIYCNFEKMNKRLIVLSGRFVYQKGFDRFIEMIPELDKDISFLFLGDGPDREKLQKRVEDLGETQRVYFLGNTDNPWKYYKIADCFVMPSRWEGMPNALLEALVCGIPCIATKESGGVEDIRELLLQKKFLEISSFDKGFAVLINQVEAKTPKCDIDNHLPKAFTLTSSYENFMRHLN